MKIVFLSLLMTNLALAQESKTILGCTDQSFAYQELHVVETEDSYEVTLSAGNFGAWFGVFQQSRERGTFKVGFAKEECSLSQEDPKLVSCGKRTDHTLRYSPQPSRPSEFENVATTWIVFETLKLTRHNDIGNLRETYVGSLSFDNAEDESRQLVHVTDLYCSEQ